MLREIGLEASLPQLAQFKIHYDLLSLWNTRINLSSIRDPEEILRRHFVESAYLTKVLPLGSGTLIDIGSGAGFPGIPVKILSPETRVVLIESVQKKARFLQEVVNALGLPGLEVFAGRVEDFQGEADWATMRAVRLDRKLMREIRRIVPRGTFAPFVVAGRGGRGQGTGKAEESPKYRTAGLPSSYPSPLPSAITYRAIPGSQRRIIAVGQCSTWNIL